MIWPKYGPFIVGAVILACFCFLFVLAYCNTNRTIARYRAERLEWITTNEERNRRVYSGDLDGVFSLANIITYETINGCCSTNCFEIICFHNFKIVETVFIAERVPIPEGAVCPMKPSEHLAHRYEDGEVVIVVHDVDPSVVDRLRDHSF